jgi:hypothetical protein
MSIAQTTDITQYSRVLMALEIALVLVKDQYPDQPRRLAKAAAIVRQEHVRQDPVGRYQVMAQCHSGFWYTCTTLTCNCMDTVSPCKHSLAVQLVEACQQLLARQYVAEYTTKAGDLELGIATRMEPPDGRPFYLFQTPENPTPGKPAMARLTLLGHCNSLERTPKALIAAIGRDVWQTREVAHA